MPLINLQLMSLTESLLTGDISYEKKKAHCCRLCNYSTRSTNIGRISYLPFPSLSISSLYVTGNILRIFAVQRLGFFVLVKLCILRL
jgi:hypothetical protein